MSLTLDQLKKMQDKAYNHNSLTRERAADDLVFYWVTQWDDNLLDNNTLAFRGEFNVLRKAGRQIISDLRANPVQINFEPKASSREDGADLIDGLYLSDDRVNTSLEAYDTASSEAVVCGLGGWELYTEYESDRGGNENQVIRRAPVNEFNNNCFWDPNAKRLDKSDANWVSIIDPYTFDGYKELVIELTGEEDPLLSMDSFANPEESYVFPWASGQNEAIYVGRFYHREKVKDKVYYMLDMMGNPIALRASDIEDYFDELMDSGYTIESERDIQRWQVTQYIVSGIDILSQQVIAGECLPVVPMYGERAFIEGEEHWEGVTRLAKDPQRLRNFQMSYLADIVSRSPRPKPIFFPEQIQGFEHMYEENGADNNFPYVYQNPKTANGEPLPIGAVAQMPETPMPTALAASIDLSRQAVEDVANPALPQDIADPDLSGKAILALQNRVDQQSMVYQQNLKHAKRRDAEIYTSMAADVYDAPRTVTLTLPDGNQKRVQIMETVQNPRTGEMEVLNDLTNMEFDVYADIGPSYASKKEETMERLERLAAVASQTDPALHKILILKIAALEDGVAMEDVRDYANKQLLIMGVKEPETEEDMQILQQQAQQAQQPDAAMVLAMAEDKKGQAAMIKEQRLAALDQEKIITDRGKLQVDVFKAQTDRAKMQVDAQAAGAEINYKNIQAIGARIDNIQKLTAPLRARVGNG